MFHYTVKTAKTPKEAISALTENLKEEKIRCPLAIRYAGKTS